MKRMSDRRLGAARYTATALLGLVGVILSARAAAAQGGQGYVAAGAGMFSNGFTSGRVVQVGGGGEASITERVGIGGDVAMTAGGGDMFAAISMNGSIHFPKPGRRTGLVPFATGGYTRLASFAESSGNNGVNAGGGLTYWFDGGKGVVLEFRDVIYRGLGTDQYWIARVGIAFR